MPVKQAIWAECDNNGCKGRVEVANIHDKPEGWYQVNVIPPVGSQVREMFIFDTAKCASQFLSKRHRALQTIKQPFRRTSSEQEAEAVDYNAAYLEKLGFVGAPPNPAAAHGRETKIKVYEIFRQTPDDLWKSSDISALVPDAHETSVRRAIYDLADLGLLKLAKGAGTKKDPYLYRLARDIIEA